MTEKSESGLVNNQSGDLRAQIDEKFEEFIDKISQSSAKNVLSSLSDFKHHSFNANTSDIRILIKKIEQELDALQIILFKTEIDVRYGGGSVADFSSVDEFVKHDTAIQDHISEITLNIEFQGVKAGRQDKERIIVEIGLRAEIPEQEYRLQNLLEDDFPNNVMWKISFSDFIMAKNVSHTIGDWVKCLPEFPADKFLMKINRSSFKSFFSSVFFVIPILSSSIFFYFCSIKFNVQNLKDFSVLILYSAFLYALVVIFVSVCRAKFWKYLVKNCPISGFDITQGDKNRISMLKNKNRQNKRGALQVIIYSFLSLPGALVVAIAANWIIAQF